MHIIGTALVIIVTFLICDWHARMVFLARAYPRRYGHGKTWKRATKHYKTRWTLLQRLLWLHVFKEKYEDKYVAFAYISYIHLVLTFITACFSVVALAWYPESRIWIYVFIAYAIFMFFRIVYTDIIATAK